MKSAGNALRIARCGRRLGLDRSLHGGGRGIRTPGTLSSTAVFKTACFNRSHIPPREQIYPGRLSLPYSGNRQFCRWVVQYLLGSPRILGRFRRLTAELDEAELPKTGTPPRGDTA